ncbi:hypothetical protein CAL7716_034860 [Calothrix sp. PCC 7716]|nr:hypothetical protein CAL7716_034860 [Calothrix sp. PCC 7716]
MKSPIQQAKEHILKVLRSAERDIKHIIYPCLPQDLADYRSALELIEVQREFNLRGITASAELHTKYESRKPKIVIATYEDVINGNLDNYLKQREMY